MERRQLIELFEQGYSPEAWRELVRKLFPSVSILAVPQDRKHDTATHADVTAIRMFADHKLQDKSRVAFYEVELAEGKQVTGRVSLRNIIAREVIPDELDAVIATYYTPNSNEWRVSLISKSMYWDDEQKLVQQETHPKRYTYVLGKGQRIKTAVDQFLQLHDHMQSAADLKGLVKAFSVEKVSKEFFQKYYQFFLQFEEYLTNSTAFFKHFQKHVDRNLPAEQQEEEAARLVRNFVKKLLGRIVFLYFLQKKGWLGVPKGKNWGEGEPDFVADLFRTAKDRTRFYEQVLVPLFFDTLNCKRTDDLFTVNGTKVPFLNGGLFDKDGIEPTEVRFDPKLWEDLFEFFGSYNFTIDENIPDDQDIGIDPEMLGQIFEQMLEEKRKTGTFYTPKEIVHYMCQESLICYLRSKLPECTEDESMATKAIERLIRHGDVGDRHDRKNFIVQQAKRIEKHLDAVKVCDPAIGSGAFPMGMLQEIFHAKMAMDLTLDRAEVKKRIIQNCVYGVDLEEGAVDIARLRFWLTLVVEETEPTPLPNLDYKIMQGNSLLERYKGVDLSQMGKAKPSIKVAAPQYDLFGNLKDSQLNLTFEKQEHTEPLQQKIKTYFSIKESEQKEVLRQEIEGLVHQHIDFNLELRERQLGRWAEEVKLSNRPTKKQEKQLEAWEQQITALQQQRQVMHDLQNSNSRPYFLWHLYFMDVFREGGFDIVIANPPYIQLQKMGAMADELQEAGYATYKRTGDIYCLFYEKGFDLLKPHGVLCYITSNSWMRTQYGQPLRQYFRERADPIALLNFEDAQLFQNATVETNILLAQKQPFAKKLMGVSVGKDYRHGMNLADYALKNHVSLSSLDDRTWSIDSEEINTLKAKFEVTGDYLKDLPYEIDYGVKTGFNPAFIIDDEIRDTLLRKHKASAEVIKPVLRGKDVQRFVISYQNLWILFVPWHFPLTDDETISGASLKAEEAFKSRYPAVYDYLKGHEKKLRERNQSETGIRYEWYALQRWGAKYHTNFSKRKIVWGELSDKPKFALDEDGVIILNTNFMLSGENLKFVY